ncbi:MAG TPA: malate/lactate/ureidoglycolate dehydrogenase [Pirellulales bacterium]|nr:malate/lactate/ureidoglycolate dehydrogenase [Pirellulales bacterium]
MASASYVPAFGAGNSGPCRSRPARWHATETANFRIYSFGATAVGPQIAERCETMRTEILRTWFGSKNDECWHPKCALVLHPHLTGYRAAVGAMADCTFAACTIHADGAKVQRRIDVRADRSVWLDHLPHELVHLIIDGRLTTGELPRWIDEGMAVTADPAARQAAHLQVFHRALARGEQFRLADLLTLADYPQRDRLGVFYGQSLSLLQFLIERGDRRKFVDFAAAALRDGYDRALASCYALENVAALERAWSVYARREQSTASRSLARPPATATLANLSRFARSIDAGPDEGICPMLVQKAPLERLAAAIFEAAGSGPAEAAAVGEHLVEANLVGHDSHGVIRIAPYINWVREKKLVPNQLPRTVINAGSIGVLDGQLGYGQVMARHATDLAIKLAKEHAIAAVALFNSGHVGRVGAWAEMAAQAGLVSLCFVNTSGGGILVAPTGGIDRRLSANPIAIAVPVRGGKPLLVDMSTCAIAEGKIRVAFNKGQLVPDNAIIDAQGRPTNDPRVFYADPPGAILPVGGHKGFGLGVMVEMLAGALTGGGCSRSNVPRLEQAMFTITIDPHRFQSEDAFAKEVQQYIDFVKSSRTVTPDGEILMPGEPEERTRFARTARGIELDDMTWGQINDVAKSLNVSTSDYV